MRLLILLGLAVLGLAACNKNDQAGNTAVAGEDLTAASIASNDVTAIDAVTGEDANMAANVNYLEPETNALGNAGAPARGASAMRPARPTTTAPAGNTTEEPAATNSAAE